MQGLLRATTQVRRQDPSVTGNERSGAAGPPGAPARELRFKAARGGRFNRLPVWIDSGIDDPFHDADAAFASLLRLRGVDVTYHTWPGGHRASYWRAHMAEYLGFYASALARCSR